MYKCSKCDFETENKSSLGGHIRNKHTNIERSEKKEFIKNCLKCNKEFSVIRNAKFNFKEPKKEKQHCSRICANSRVWSDEHKIKLSESCKNSEKIKKANAFRKGNKGSGWKHSKESNEKRRKKILEFYDKKGRLPKQHYILRNREGVALYRARKKDAIKEDSNLKLISEIYKMCPKGYEVDHIVALAAGGSHHQDNLQYLPILENRKKNKYQKYDKSLVIDWKMFLKKD